jgi:hypothetical protein
MKCLPDRDAANAREKDCRIRAASLLMQITTRGRQVEKNDGMKAVRMVVVSINLSYPLEGDFRAHLSIITKVPIQEEMRTWPEILSLRNERQNAVLRDVD